MNYIQYMKPGGNFSDKLKVGIKKFLKAAGEASRMTKDARINNPGAAMIRNAYTKGDEELAKLLTDEMQAANLAGIALSSSTVPLITGFTVAPVTTGATLATGMAGGMAGMYGTDKAINYFSDGKYTGWGDWVNLATNGAIGESTAGFFHPGTIFGGLAAGKIGNKIIGVTNRGKLELLNSALNKNILATTLQPTVADKAVLRGQLGWAPKQTIYYRHGSLDPELKTFVPKHDRWDVVTHGADPNMYFVTDLSTPVSAANMMDLRPYQYTGSIVAEKPMVQVGDFNVAGKNATRNQLIARARQQGADTYLLQDIVDNKVPHLNVVARFIGPEGEAVQGGALLQTKTTPTKTSLAFFEKEPANVTEAERLGIPKVVRNLPTSLRRLLGEGPYDELADKGVFGALIGEGSESAVYLHASDPTKVLKVNVDINGTVNKGRHAAIKRYIDQRNSLGIQLPIELEGIVLSNGQYRPVFSLKKVELLPDNLIKDYALWREYEKNVLEPFFLNLGFKRKLGGSYVKSIDGKATYRIDDISPYNIGVDADGNPILFDVQVERRDWKTGKLFKQGGSIHIKKKNLGSFTRYCNGKVTEECIRRGKNSSNPTTRKRANFAWVARHKFKHQDGDKINYLNVFK